MSSNGREAAWKNRIVGHGEEDPEQLLANPKNWRIHPDAQQQALKGVLTTVGWVDEVKVNRTSGCVVDGHLRVALALRHHQPSVPVKYVELTEAEEDLILATLDPIAAMAKADKQQLDALLHDVQSGDAAVQAMLAELVEKSILYHPDLTPDLTVTPYNDDDVSQARDKLDNAFNKERKLEPVKCPKCGEEFYVDA